MIAQVIFNSWKGTVAPQPERIYKNRSGTTYYFEDGSKFIVYTDGRIAWGTKKKLIQRQEWKR